MMSEEDVVEGRTEFGVVNFDFDGIEVTMESVGEIVSECDSETK